MSKPYVCNVPTVPPSMNEWTKMHWAYKRRLRDAFQHDLMVVLNEKGNRCPKDQDYVECKAVITFTVRRRRDAENFGAVLWKWAADVLVRQGIIPDDTPEHILCHSPGMTVGDTEGTLIVLHFGREAE